jgi:hypothetical protein
LNKLSQRVGISLIMLAYSIPKKSKQYFTTRK